MKRKLVSILLAMTLCVGLAIPAFAEEAEELPIPEEAEDFWVREANKHEEEIECVGPSRCFIDFSDSAWVKVENKDGVMAITHEESMHGSRLAEGSMGYLCDQCGRDNWGPPTEKEHKFRNTGNPNTHEEYYTVIYICKTADCPGGFADDYTIWTSHSMSKIDYGSNYHRGTLHYVEWIWRCSDCGYTESRWESQKCPGNDNGEGCIFGINKVEPPVEEQDVAEPEEVAEPENVVEPEEVIEPEDATEPEETTEPEEVADIPEEVEMPEVTEAPEETVDTEDPAGEEETTAPDDGE